MRSCSGFWAGDRCIQPALWVDLGGFKKVGERKRVRRRGEVLAGKGNKAIHCHSAVGWDPRGKAQHGSLSGSPAVPTDCHCPLPGETDPQGSTRHRSTGKPQRLRRRGTGHICPVSPQSLVPSQGLAHVSIKQEPGLHEGLSPQNAWRPRRPAWQGAEVPGTGTDVG